MRPDQSQWRVRVPFRPIAMVPAGEKLILAGPPDSPDPREALAAVQGRRGATLWVINAADGEKLATLRRHGGNKRALLPRHDRRAGRLSFGRDYCPLKQTILPSTVARKTFP